MKGEILLKVKAKHFKDTDYCDNYECAISKAAKELFPNVKITEGVNEISINGVDYFHKSYYADHFDSDLEKAEMHNYDDAVIFELNIIRK